MLLQTASPYGSRQIALGRSDAWSLDWRIATILLVACHVAVWSWVGVASRTNLDVPGDMVETYVWGQALQWGYDKHPPLAAWIAGLWFRVVPEGHFGFALLAALNTGVGLMGVAMLARRLLPPDWAFLCVAATALTPGVTTIAMRFNANAVLVATWPWATAMFVTMMQTGRRRHAVACGTTCALALLGKYYSGVLLLSLLITAVSMPLWRRRFATPLPWLAMAVFALVLLPHLTWLSAQSAGPLQYARAAANQSPGDSLVRALYFGVSQWLFPALAFGLLAVAIECRDRGPAMRAAIWSVVSPRRDVAWLLGALPIAATMLATLVTGARAASVWGIPIGAGVAILAATRARSRGARIDIRRALVALVAAWILVCVLAPALWLTAARKGTATASEPREEVSQVIEAMWLKEFGQPLRWVAGTRAVAASVSFYDEAHPGYWSVWNVTRETPWVDLNRVRADGAAIVCEVPDSACIRLAGDLATQRSVVSVAKHARGFDFAPHRYEVFLMPPLAEFTATISR